MKKLLRKELTLCTNPQVIIFCLLSVMVIIPNWPSIIAFVYAFSGITTIFPRALADQDLQYTAMLPIRKKDVVKGKTLLIVMLELASILISIPCAVAKILYIDPMMIGTDPSTANYTLAVQPTMGAYGFALLAFAVFNVVILPWYYKNPAKVNWPPFISMMIGLFVLGLGAGAEAIVNLSLNFDHSTMVFKLTEGGILLGGILIYILLTALGEEKAEKNFDKVDL
jgi:hypothetical protein